MSDMVKEEDAVQDTVLDVESDNSAGDVGGNASDRRNMLRMGKVQELKRNFRFLSILGFVMILECSWESILALASIGLENGGTAGLIWMFLPAVLGFLLVNISLAEMASMAPTTGGQYHWVSELAPRKYQKFLSYLIGWLCLLGWQANSASTAFVGATEIQGLVVLNYPNYVFENWHGTLITIGYSVFAVFFNTVLAHHLPLIESMVLLVHIFAFFGILVALWVLGPRAPASDVFTQFTNGGGFPTTGVSVQVGLMAGVASMLGADSAVHMSEEVKDASRTIPKAIIWSTVVNGIMGWIMAITFCFVLGDVDSVLSTPTGYPFIQVFYNVTQSTAGATAMSVFVVAMVCFANLTVIAAASRQLWSFARDNGVPFSPVFARVRNGIPINAVLTTFVVTSLLSLINIGSSTALNSIVSLSTAALLSSYIVSIGCMIWRRVTNQQLLPAPMSLGKWGLAINIVSEAWLIWAFFWAFWPSVYQPTPETMNWMVAIFGGAILFSMVYYFLKGRHRYVGPVEYVRKLD